MAVSVRVEENSDANSEHSARRSIDVKHDVAVIIVSYKSAGLTIESLRSLLLERTNPKLRIRAVVVDNASGDLADVSAAIEQNGWSDWVTAFASPRNGGFAYGNNLGIRRAFADGLPCYVYLLNPDAQIRTGAISSLVEFLESNAEVGIAGGSFDDCDGSDSSIAFRFPNALSELNQGLEFGLVTRLLEPWIAVKYMSNSNERVDWVCGAAMMIRTSVFGRVGGLDESYFLYFEETDFCRRAHAAGISTWFVAASRVMHIGGQSTTVTDTRLGRKRLPGYWFESRRRYFVSAFGIGHAKFIDIIAVLAHVLGHLKRCLQLRRRRAIPHYIRDLLRYSVLWPRNGDIPDPVIGSLGIPINTTILKRKNR